MYRSKQVIKGIKQGCIDSNERLYLANSTDLIRLFYSLHMLEKYPKQMFTDFVALLETMGKKIPEEFKSIQADEEKQKQICERQE